jgi:hypothetical protein
LSILYYNKYVAGIGSYEIEAQEESLIIDSQQTSDLENFSESMDKNYLILKIL